MKKLKKLFMSFGIFMTSLITKVSAAVSLTYDDYDARTVEGKYGVLDPRMYAPKYGIFEPEPTMGEKITSIGKFALPIILFVIGLFVILSKKITKKVKVIVVSILAILAIFGYVLMNYISKSF